MTSSERDALESGIDAARTRGPHAPCPLRDPHLVAIWCAAKSAKLRRPLYSAERIAGFCDFRA